MRQSNDDGVILLIGSGRRPYRQYLIEGLAERAPLWLIDKDPASWQSPYLAGSSVVPMLNASRSVLDEAGLTEAAAKVDAERGVAGVCTYDEGTVIAAAVVAERLGRPGLTVAGAERCRDKHLTRKALTAAGLLQPQFALAATLAEAADAAARIGYPVVLKPRGMGASAGVVLVTSPDDLAEAYRITTRASHAGPLDFEQGLLVEECVEGPEISVDGAITGGEYHAFCLARKQLGPPPCFEETGHIVDAHDPLTRDQSLLTMLAEAHRVLGLQDGITHTEIKLTARGPVIIEVNGRLGGDLIPYLGRLATGIDPGQVAGDVVRGLPPELTLAHHQVAGIRFLYPPVDCRVAGVSLPTPEQVPGLVSAVPLAPVDSLIYLPPRMHLARYACLIARTGDPESCQAALDQAAALSSIETKPLTAAELEPEHVM